MDFNTIMPARSQPNEYNHTTWTPNQTPDTLNRTNRQRKTRSKSDGRKKRSKAMRQLRKSNSNMMEATPTLRQQQLDGERSADLSLSSHSLIEDIDTISDLEDFNDSDLELPIPQQTVRHNLGTLESHLTDIITMPLKDLPRVVKEYAKESRHQDQEPIIRACLQRMLRPLNDGRYLEPHKEQVQLVRRLVYGKSDAIFVARTGFGKSLILQAFTVLTGQITILVVPLNTIGEQQEYSIRQMSDCQSIFLNAQSKRDSPEILSDIRQYRYTHIILSPEQLLSSTLRDILKDPVIKSKIGLVAIDECHLLAQWGSFRPAFKQLQHIRPLLRHDVSWFACTATLSLEMEKEILTQGGFQPLGPGLQQTQVIRASVDRPEIFLDIQCIPRGTIGYNSLYFLIGKSIDAQKKATPQSIPKTLIFVNTITEVNELARWFRRTLLTLTANYRTRHGRYNNELRSTSPYSVLNVIQEYHSRVYPVDKDLRLDEFRKSSSISRIIVTTSILREGFHVRGIERIVLLFKHPRDISIESAVQAGGRGARGPGESCIFHMLFPYWCFDSEARPRPSTQSTQSDPDNTGWNPTERTQREAMPKEWTVFLRATCYRQALLSYLGEDRLPRDAQKRVSAHDCCSACNLTRIPLSSLEPLDILKSASAPNANNKPQTLALDLINEWARVQANQHQRSWIPQPPDAYMHKELRWALSTLYQLRRRKHIGETLIEIDDRIGATVLELEKKVPILLTWPHWETQQQILFQYLRKIVSDVHKVHAESKISSSQITVTQIPQGPSQADQGDDDSVISSVPMNNTEETHRKNDYFYQAAARKRTADLTQQFSSKQASIPLEVYTSRKKQCRQVPATSPSRRPLTGIDRNRSLTHRCQSSYGRPIKLSEAGKEIYSDSQTLSTSPSQRPLAVLDRNQMLVHRGYSSRGRQIKLSEAGKAIYSDAI